MCGVEAHGGVAIPAAGLASRTLGMAGLGGSVDLVSVVEEAFVLTSMALRGRDEGDAAVTVLLIYQATNPATQTVASSRLWKGLPGKLGWP